MTPVNANIVLPPQGIDWPALSNPPVVRYFLYPRNLISAKVVTNNLFDELGTLYFVLINDTDIKNWPLLDKEKKTVIFHELKLDCSEVELLADDSLEVYKITK